MEVESNRTNTVDHLIKAASLLPSLNHTHRLLKSYYLTKCKRLVQSDQIQSNTFLSDEEMCRKCSTPWTDMSYSMSIAAIKTTKRQARKIHRQIENKSNRKNQLAKKLLKKVNNVMSIKCDFCQNKNRVVLWKKSISQLMPAQDQICQTQPVVTMPVPIVKTTPKTVQLTELPKKKKRKKDKHAGLLFSVNKDDNRAVKVVLTPKPQTPTMPKKAKQAQKPNANQNKQKAAKAKLKNAFQPVQNRNSLMQLANALKAKSNQSNSNSLDKLKQMLR